MSSYTPEEIEASRYFGVDPKEVAAGFVTISPEEFDQHQWSPEDQAAYEQWCASTEQPIDPVQEEAAYREFVARTGLSDVPF
jgi:hypothetical protein